MFLEVSTMSRKDCIWDLGLVEQCNYIIEKLVVFEKKVKVNLLSGLNKFLVFPLKVIIFLISLFLVGIFLSTILINFSCLFYDTVFRYANRNEYK